MHFQLILRSGPDLGLAPAAVPQLCFYGDLSSFGPWLLISCICVSGVQIMKTSDVSFFLASAEAEELSEHMNNYLLSVCTTSAWGNIS